MLLLKFCTQTPALYKKLYSLQFYFSCVRLNVIQKCKNCPVVKFADDNGLVKLDSEGRGLLLVAGDWSLVARCDDYYLELMWMLRQQKWLSVLGRTGFRWNRREVVKKWRVITGDQLTRKTHFGNIIKKEESFRCCLRKLKSFNVKYLQILYTWSSWLLVEFAGEGSLRRVVCVCVVFLLTFSI